MCYRADVCDPRDPSSEATLHVIYEARPGAPPTYWEPADAPEYRLDEAINKRGQCVLRRLTPVQYLALEDAIHQQHQF